MKISIKTLQGKQLPVEIEDTNTIQELKDKIASEHNMDASLMKLIAYGKVMEDNTKVLKDYSIKDGDFLVVMISKAKPAPKPAAEQAPAQAASADAPAQPAASSTGTAQNVNQVSQPASAPAETPQNEAQVQDLISISGKPREDCIAALRAAFGDPNRAFEYLMSGIPAQSADPAQAPPAGAADMADDYGDEVGLPSAGAGGGVNAAALGALQGLASNPNFEAIRQRIISDPNFYNQFMNQLQTSQPQLFALIQSNPGAFMQLILGGGAGGAGGAGAGAGGAPPGSIRVSPEEMAAIERLVQLGFPKHKAAEAYFACDKNEEMAANFLFENGMDDDEDMARAQAASAAAAGQPAANQAPPAQPEQPAQQPAEQPAAPADPASAADPPADPPAPANNDNANNNNNAPGGNDDNDNDEGGSSLQ